MIGHAFWGTVNDFKWQIFNQYSVKSIDIENQIYHELRSNWYNRPNGFNSQFDNETKKYPKISIQNCNPFVKTMLVGNNQSVSLKFDEDTITELKVCKNYIKNNRQLEEELARENSIIEDIVIKKINPSNDVNVLAQMFLRACEKEMIRAVHFQDELDVRLNPVQLEAVGKCANLQLKFRYSSFLNSSSIKVAENKNLWHSKVRDVVELNKNKYK